MKTAKQTLPTGDQSWLPFHTTLTSIVTNESPKMPPQIAAAPSGGCDEILAVPKTPDAVTHAWMGKKPVIERKNSRTVITLKARKFEEKLLCDAITINPGDACVFNCGYCFSPAAMIKIDQPVINEFNLTRTCQGLPSLKHQDVVIRRPHAVELLRNQLFDQKGRRKFDDPDDNRIVYGSTLVDVAPNMTLLKETADLCNLILENTAWQIRLLSKGNLLHRLFRDKLIPDRHRDRVILGFSTGTLEDNVARAIENGTALVSKRLEALHWLQDEGYRTFGMVCPSLPQSDGQYERFSREICDAIRVDRCEHVWAEVINLRGESLTRTLAALSTADLNEEAEALSAVMGPRNKDAWENYARATFLAHTKHVPAQKLRFLQYVVPSTADWWAEQRQHGAILLGKVAEKRNLTALVG